MAYSSRPGQSIGERIAARSAIQTRMIRKATEHLLGICAGLTADNHISADEVMYLKNWLSNHPEVTDEWPGKVIAARVTAILEDGMITAAESYDLLDTLRQLSGNHLHETGTAAADQPILPIDDDPSIYFQNMSFCLTGKFIFGTRAACERLILRVGGTVVDTITQRTNYLIIGGLIEPQWAHTTYGRKIEKAVQYKAAGVDIIIASEQQWTEQMLDVSRTIKT